MNVVDAVKLMMNSKFFTFKATPHVFIADVVSSDFYFVIDYEYALLSLYNKKHDSQYKMLDGTWATSEGDPIVIHWSIFDITDKMVGVFSEDYIEEFSEFVMIDLLFMSSEYELEK